MVLPFATTEFGGGLFPGCGPGSAGPLPPTGKGFEGLEFSDGLGASWPLLGFVDGFCASGLIELTLLGSDGGLGLG